MVILYGIRNCDTVRNARRWLAEHGIEYRFHDLRRDGLDTGMLDAWIGDFGWERLINRRGTTWRALSAEQRERLDAARARDIMLAHPGIIRRPILERGTSRHLGFTASHYAALFS